MEIKNMAALESTGTSREVKVKEEYGKYEKFCAGQKLGGNIK